MLCHNSDKVIMISVIYIQAVFGTNDRALYQKLFAEYNPDVRPVLFANQTMFVRLAVTINSIMEMVSFPIVQCSMYGVFALFAVSGVIRLACRRYSILIAFLLLYLMNVNIFCRILKRKC